MGNHCCNDQGAREFLLMRKNPLVEEELSQSKKVEILEIIKKNDVKLIDEVLKTVSPLENLYDEAYNFTFLHAAATFESFAIVGSILSHIRKSYSHAYREIVNIVDRSFATPAMLCVINNSPKTLLALLTDGQVDIIYKNFQGDNLISLAKSCDNKCKEIVDYYLKVIIPKKKKADMDDILDKLAHPQSDRVSSIDSNDIDKFNKSFEYTTRILNSNSKLMAIKTFEQILKTRSEQLNGNPNQAVLERVAKNTECYRVLNESVNRGVIFDDSNFSGRLDVVTRRVNDPLFKDVIWRRAHEILGCKIEEMKYLESISHKNYTISTDYNPVQSAIAAFSEYPARIYDIFVNHTTNPYGVYSIRLFSNGVWREIVIDDKLPVKKSFFGGGDLLFLKPKEDIIWGLLLEKAIAKSFGSYYASQEASMEDIVEYMSGSPTNRFEIEPLLPFQTWDRLKSAYQFNNIVIASSNSPKFIDNKREDQFTLISIHEVSNEMFIKLRYPWGKVNFESDFAKITSEWPEEKKIKLGKYEPSEGMVMLTLMEFVTYFQYMVVSQSHPGWDLTNFEKKNSSLRGDYYTFTNSTLNYAYFRLHYLSKNALDFYPSTEFIIARQNEEGDLENLVPYPNEIDKTCQEGAKTVYPGINHLLKLLPGKYYIRIKQQSQGQPNNVPYSISCFSESKIMIQECPKVENFLSLLYRGDPRNANKLSKKKNCFFFYAFNGNNAYVFAENKKPKKTWCLDVQFTELENLRLGKPFKTSENSMLIIVPPKTTQIAYIKSIDWNKTSKFNWIVTQYWQKKPKVED